MNMRTLLTLCILGGLGLFGPIRAQAEAGDAISGTVYTVGPTGAKSMVAGAMVKLTGPSLSLDTITSQTGAYNFGPLPQNTYRIDVTAPGLSGSKTVTVTSGSTLDIPIE